MAGENHILVGSEVFYSASGAAKYLNIKRGMFYSNVRKRVQAYKLGARKNYLYKQSDLEPFRTVQPIERIAS